MSMVSMLGMPSAAAARRAAVVAPERSARAQVTSIWSASSWPRRWWLACSRTAHGAVWATAIATSSGATMIKGPGQERRRTSVSAQAQVWQEMGAVSSAGCRASCNPVHWELRRVAREVAQAAEGCMLGGLSCDLLMWWFLTAIRL